MNERPRMVRVTASNQCPVCQHGSWCLIAPDKSASICARVESKKKCGEAGWLHVHSEQKQYTPPPRRTVAEKPMLDWSRIAMGYATKFTDAKREELANILRLPTAALINLRGLGADDSEAGTVYLFPERNGDGLICGLNRRFPNGEKKFVPGGNRGLTLPQGWSNVGELLYVVEGPTDCMAMNYAGLSVWGRFSNIGGASLIAQALKKVEGKPIVVIVGENDRRFSEERNRWEWPGLAGAVSVARELQKLVKNEVHWTLPPEDYKDARDYMTSEYFDGRDWNERGKDVNEELLSRSQLYSNFPEEYGSIEELHQSIGFDSNRWKY